MAEIATRLDTRETEGGVLATIDPVEAGNNRPCLLVVPPVVDYLGGTMDTPNHQVRVMALARSSHWGTDALDETAALLDHAEQILDELARAEPTLYRLTPEQTIPAYVLTFDTL